MSLAEALWRHVNYTDALIDRKRGILLDWSAKAGCTIGSMMLYRYMGIADEVKAFSLWAHVFRVKVFYRRYGLATYDDLLSPDILKLKIVREPFDRTVSSYIHAMKYPDPDLKAWSGSDAPDLSFREFLRFVETRDRFVCNPHYRTQYKRYEEEGVRFDHVLRLENLDVDLAALRERDGVAFDAEGLTSEHHVKKGNEVELGAADRKWSSFDQIPAYDSFFDTEAEATIVRLYKPDFSYGYAPEASRRGPIPRAGEGASLIATATNRGGRRLRYKLFDLVRQAALPFRRQWHH